MLAAALAFIISAAFAEESPVRVEVADAMGAPGGTVPLNVHFIIPTGAHIYAEMIDIQVVDAAGLSIGEPVEPAGKLVADPANPAKQREIYEAGDTAVELPVTLPKDATGTYALKLLVRHQACRVGLCYPAAEIALSAKIGVAGVLSVPGIGTAAAQSPAEDVPAYFTPGAPTPGTVAVHVDLQGEWHINKMFVGLTVTDPKEGFTVGDLLLPTPVPSGSEADGTYREDFKRDFNIVAPVTGAAGPVELTLDVAYQACKGLTLCQMPTSVSVKVPVTVLAVGVAPTLPAPDSLYTEPDPAAAPPAVLAAAPPAEDDAADDDDEDAFAAAAKKGYLFLLGFCFVAGVVVSFTPCVLPMVPINMSIIGARGASSRAAAFALASAYVAGQVMVYTVLGVGAGLTGALFGSWLQNPLVLGGIGSLFVVLGFSMFGFFDLQVPSFVQNRISGFERRGGFAVAFIFGMIGGMLAGPCSGPVVIGILGVIATGAGQGATTGTNYLEVAKGASLMATFALGMGMIFLVAGAAAGWMPKRGAYMAMIKKSFGIVMWLGAIYFAAPLLTTVQTALATSAVLLITGVFSWPDAEDGEGFYTQRVRQLYTIVAVIVGGWLLVATLMTEGFIFPKLNLGANGGGAGTSAAATATAIPWLHSEAEGLAASAAAGGKPLMIDFTAAWCAACHELEKLTYPDPEVVAAAADFVPVMIDCTDRASPEVTALQAKYGVKGLPTIVFVRPDGTELGRNVEFITAERMAKKIRKAKAKAG